MSWPGMSNLYVILYINYIQVLFASIFVLRVIQMCVLSLYSIHKHVSPNFLILNFSNQIKDLMQQSYNLLIDPVCIESVA